MCPTLLHRSESVVPTLALLASLFFTSSSTSAPDPVSELISSEPMACTQQQHIDRQANGGAGERTSLLDTVDSGVKATEGGHLVGSSKPMACTQKLVR